MQRFLAFLTVVLTTTFALAGALRADGVLEINQACALNGGCFPGDAPGFPVTIMSAGNYRLTGNLDLSAQSPATPAIEAQVAAINIDLGGFVISGPSSCTGSGSTIVCDFADNGYGVHFFSAAAGSSLRNGTIKNMAGWGVLSNAMGVRVSEITSIHNREGIVCSENALISDSVVIENWSDGVDTGGGSIVKQVMAFGNGNHGIEIDDSGGTVLGSTSRGNGARGFNISAESKFGHDNVSNGNAAEDNCGGGICTPLRRYYFATGPFQGYQPDFSDACDPGFHFASLWELSDLGRLAFDQARSPLSHDAGSGPPVTSVALGWIRTGWSGSGNNEPGFANCRVWNDGTPDDYGTIAVLSVNGGSTFPWVIDTATCDSELPAWCVEDL